MIKSNIRREAMVILECDDAVKDGYAAYTEAGFDETKLTLEGEPTRWRLQPLTYDQRLHVADMQAPAQRREFLLRASLLGVTGYKVSRDGGPETEMRPVEHEDSQQFKRAMVKRAWLQDANLPTSATIELSLWAMNLSEGTIPFPDH